MLVARLREHHGRYADNRAWQERVRMFVPLPAVAFVWWLLITSKPPLVELGLWVYALANATLLIGLMHPLATRSVVYTRGILVGLMVADLAFGLLLLMQAGPLGLAIYPIYILISLKVLALHRRFPATKLVPFLLGPSYVYVLYFTAQHPNSLQFFDHIANWGLIVGSLGFGAAAVWANDRHVTRYAHLQAQVEQERRRHNAALQEVTSIADGLRERVREQYMLRESMRAVSSTLSLDAVLTQILESASQLLASTRASGTILSLWDADADQFDHLVIAQDVNLPDQVVQQLARHVVEHNTALLIDDASRNQYAWLHGTDLCAVIATPLTGAGGKVRGVLAVVSTQRNTFSHVEARYLDAFALQASVAMRNAELHDRVARQEQLMTAVIRDIADGLVVLDQRGVVMHQNALARALIGPDALHGPQTMAELVRLSRELDPAGPSRLCREIQVPRADQDQPQTFRAYASLVALPNDTYHTAIVLHDITAAKDQERIRADFVAMVSHELRNPLHSLNGFLKIVLQGKAGALTPLQREFLEVVDEQVEQLKGRVAELLEFNRLESGRLTLHPEWSDLALLVTGVVARLTLDVEKAGLTLNAILPPDLPEIFVDSGRVGQVITNLVENAVKATAPGGNITITATVGSEDVRIMVSDSGVGIPPEQLPRIFDRFYRVHHKASHHGAHLGLGLSICQQIVEGHGGRIWVESEVGKGSQFTFSLPLRGLMVDAA